MYGFDTSQEAAVSSMFLPLTTDDQVMGDYLDLLKSGQAGGYDTGSTGAVAKAGTGISAWLQQNKMTVFAGVGVLVALKIFSGSGGRR